MDREEAEEFFDRMLKSNEDIRPEEIASAVSKPGFYGLLNMLLEAKQGEYVKLSRLDLSAPAQVMEAAKAQGRIDAIDSIRDLVCDVLTKETTNG